MTPDRAPGVLKALLLALAGAPLFAGPPFKTDDPQPVDLGQFELYGFWMGQQAPGGRSGIGPAVEFNEGILPETQFHLIVPYAYNRPQDGPSQRGNGDLEIGVKIRFLAETDSRPQIGIFPIVDLPTGRVDKGLGSGHTQVYLPIWIQKGWGSWTTYGGFGWWRNPGEGNRNYTFTGWLLQRDLGEKLTLGAELFHATSMTILGQAATGFDAGGQFNLSRRHHILFSAGRNVRGDGQSYFYLGYQLTAGGFGSLGDWFKGGRPRS
jgi:hypothetical protein